MVEIFLTSNVTQHMFNVYEEFPMCVNSLITTQIHKFIYHYANFYYESSSKPWVDQSNP